MRDCQTEWTINNIDRTHHSNRCLLNRVPGRYPIRRASYSVRVLFGCRSVSHEKESTLSQHQTTSSRRIFGFRLKGWGKGNAKNGSLGFHCVAIDFTGIMIHVRNQFRFSSRGTDALSKNAACVCAQAAFCSMQASSGDCRFFRQSAAPGLSLPPPWRHRESRLQPRIYAITAPLPPPMLHCAEVYGYRFPVASSFQS